MARSIGAALLLLAAAAGCGSSVGSVGAVLGQDNDTGALHVRDVPPGLSADRAGLLPGDEIVMIDGVHVRDLSASDIRERLRGEVGTSVELTIVRANEVLRVRVVRGEMRVRETIQPKEEKIEP